MSNYINVIINSSGIALLLLLSPGRFTTDAFHVQSSSSLKGQQQHYQHCSSSVITLYQSSDDGDGTTSTSQPAMSQQDLILQAALGIEPETDADKEQRQSAVQTSLVETSNNNRNMVLALLSFTAALGNYLYQYTHPITDVQLLYTMSQTSCPVTEIGNNGKPTVVDFWAPWCDNCKRSASTLALMEKEYGDQVNFVMINGDLRESWDLIEKFHVDAIPHLALVSPEGDIETALIGPIPSNVLRADLDVLTGSAKASSGTPVPTMTAEDKSKNLREALPYKMFDPFQGKDEIMRRVTFTAAVEAK